MNDWTLIYDRYQPEHERLREALCTLGNGYFATRGAMPGASANSSHYPGTYVAGVFNRLSTEIAGETVENESLVNAPNWLVLQFRIDGGDWFDIDRVTVLDFHQELDLKQVLLNRKLRFRDAQGRTTRLHEQRLVSLDSQHLAALQLVIEAEDWSGSVEIRSALDGSVTNSGVDRYSELASRHLEVRHTAAEDDTLLLVADTNQSHIRIAQAATTRLWRNDERLHPAVEPEREPAQSAHRLRVDIEQSEPLQVEKIVALYTSQDHAITAPELEARKAVSDDRRYADIAFRHTHMWKQLWRRFDFDLEHNDMAEQERTEQVLRLHILHLLQTTSPHVMDLDVGVPARGLHGEAYRGHIFWDELFIFPLLNLRMPEITRALMRYRYRRLSEARRAAREAGLRGAMYPWQSGSNGREESQRIHLNPKSGNWIPDNSRLQRHINSAIAYNAWQYYQVTGDSEFLAFFGAEMIFEIARFWASLANYNEELERYEIRGVLGPDEYHDAYPDSDQRGLNNNAYTNVMAVWVLCRALELRKLLPGRRLNELWESLELEHDEFEHWETISRSMFIPFHGDGIISQFEGYEQLQEFDWEGYRKKYGDIQRLDRILEAEDDTPNRYRVSKQADVLMLFYLFSSEELQDLFERLGYPFEYDTIPRNIEYYLQRTSHGSTLSRVVHSWVLARANRAGGWQLFREALESDVADIQGGTTQEGIHTGAMAGTVDLMQRCFTGLETRGGVLRLNPCLPEGLDRLSLNIAYRRQLLELCVTPTLLRVTAEPSELPPITLCVDDEQYELAPGQVREFRL